MGRQHETSTGFSVSSTRPHRIVALLLAACWAFASGCMHHIPLDHLTEDLRRKDIETISMYDGFTLVSPYDPLRTAEIGAMIQEELSLVADLFEIDPTDPVFVELRPVEVKGVEVRHVSDNHFQVVGDAQPPSHSGIAGAAGSLRNSGRAAMIIYVAGDKSVESPSGKQVPMAFKFDYRSTIRHELAHVCHELMGLEIEHTWLSEGIAVTVETMEVEDGRLQHTSFNRELFLCSRIHRYHQIQELLDWSENLEEIMAKREDVFTEGRPLAMSLIRYLLSRNPEESFPAGIRRIVSMSREELLSHEKGWHTWLEGISQRFPFTARLRHVIGDDAR